MILLELTHQESDFLKHCLAGSAQLGSPTAQQLLTKLHAACQLDRPELLCPVCQLPFAQRTHGRNQRYCSNACKQRAYRQRTFDMRRRHYPPPRS